MPRSPTNSELVLHYSKTPDSAKKPLLTCMMIVVPPQIKQWLCMVQGNMASLVAVRQKKLIANTV